MTDNLIVGGAANGGEFLVACADVSDDSEMTHIKSTGGRVAGLRRQFDARLASV